MIAAVRGLPPPQIHPANSYIGQMLAEVAGRTIDEPYRIFTSRSPHRLHLRQSNAESRLTDEGLRLGVVTSRQAEVATAREARIAAAERTLRELPLPADVWQQLVPDHPWPQHERLDHLLRQPAIDIEALRPWLPDLADLDAFARDELETRVKYAGYLAREERDLARRQALHGVAIPTWMLVEPPAALSTEARHKIAARRPANLGELADIPGVRATDVALVAALLRHEPPTVSAIQSTTSLPEPPDDREKQT